MTRKLRIDGAEIDPDSLSAKAKEHLEAIRFTDVQIAELTNRQALLRRAKRAYTTDLENEIIKSKTGIDISSLFAD